MRSQDSNKSEVIQGSTRKPYHHHHYLGKCHTVMSVAQEGEGMDTDMDIIMDPNVLSSMVYQRAKN